MPDPLRFNPSDPAVESQAGRTGERRQKVVVKVRQPGYVPPGFQVRVRLDDRMFTAEVDRDDLAVAAEDPEIEALEYARGLHPGDHS